MSRSTFDPAFDQLPRVLPLFPLTGVLLLPRSRLPLNVFEPRYLAMTRDALAGERLIGMVQPQEGAGDAGEPPVYRTGCAGRLTEFAETDDGRYLITLTGLLRFDIGSELPRDRPYRRVEAEWQRFKGDLDDVAAASIDRKRLMAALHPFFDRHGIEADWSAIEKAPEERLVTTLAAACPFAPREKQALLEAADAGERALLLVALIEMAVLGGDATVAGARH
jgi:uncharacterized protein